MSSQAFTAREAIRSQPFFNTSLSCEDQRQPEAMSHCVSHDKWQRCAWQAFDCSKSDMAAPAPLVSLS
jgi:hypothetical protein